MGFVLTLIYTGLAVLSPADLVPELAPYRIMIWISLLAIAASAPNILHARWLRLPQSNLMFAMIAAICLSRILNGSLGAVASSLATFLPVAIIFFLVIWNVNTNAQLRTLSALLIGIALYSLIRGAVAYHTGDEQSPYVVTQPVWINESLGLRTSYLRIRALGFLNDPNDFAQYLLMLLPLLRPLWQQGRFFTNLLLCIIPGALLVYGIYLTNSRGALIGLLLLAFLAVRAKLGGTRAFLLAPLALAALLMLNHGGRSISVHEDSAMGRVNAWSEGLGMFEESPLWGVGFGQFTNRYEITAHNSYVLCMSELGLIGCIAWIGLIASSVLQLQKAAASEIDAFEAGDTHKWAAALRSSLYATLATCWFLSRTYSATLYLSLGMSVALSAQDSVAREEDVPPTHWMRLTLVTVPVLIGAVYVTVRMRSL